MAKLRNRRVMVRLASGRGASPDEVRFTGEEKTAVSRAAKACGRPLSTFIREVGVGAAQATLDPGDAGDHALISAAAEACNLRLGEWLRVVVLAAIGHTQLPVHMKAGEDYIRSLVE